MCTFKANTSGKKLRAIALILKCRWKGIGQVTCLPKSLSFIKAHVKIVMNLSKVLTTPDQPNRKLSPGFRLLHSLFLKTTIYN